MILVFLQSQDSAITNFCHTALQVPVMAIWSRKIGSCVCPVKQVSSKCCLELSAKTPDDPLARMVGSSVKMFRAYIRVEEAGSTVWIHNLWCWLTLPQIKHSIQIATNVYTNDSSSSYMSGMGNASSHCVKPCFPLVYSVCLLPCFFLHLCRTTQQTVISKFRYGFVCSSAFKIQIK